MAKLKDIDWWTAFWASIISPSGAEIFAKGTFKGCNSHSRGLSVAFTIDGGPNLETIPPQSGVDFYRLCAQLSRHQGKPMSFINELDVIT